MIKSVPLPLTKPNLHLAKTGPPILLLSLAFACGGASERDSASDTDAMDSEGAGTQDASAGEMTSPTADADGSETSSTDAGSSSDSGDATIGAVDLGMAGEFVILAKSGISVVPPADVTGDVGLSPAAASLITGFSLTADPTNVFATSAQVTGNVYAADYEPPTPANMTAAIADMELAFTDAAGRAPDVTELGAGDIGGMTLEPGVYKWGTGLLVPTDVTLEGSATDVWIFQIGQDLTVAGGAHVLLSGGALPQNIVWQVAGLVEVGTTAHCEGVVLTQTSITMATGASINGRLFAQTAVDLDSNTVVEPAD